MGENMKKMIIFIISFLLIIDVIDNKYLNNYVYTFIKDYFNKYDYNIIIDSESIKENEYSYKEYTSLFKTTSNFNVTSKEDIMNIYYTALNNGFNDFSYYCDKAYKTCFTDITELSNDSEKFTYINQFVHPYYSFNTIETISSNNRIDININKKYYSDDIKKIDNEINRIINELNINNYSSIRDKIKIFHDYLANINVYDKIREETNDSSYHSDSAIGTLFEGHSVCSGYTDTLAIFLNKLGLENIKVITDEHTWNAVKIDDKWYHIDLTWDDPIVNDGSNIILYDYFLIDTNSLLKKDTEKHNFDKDIYNFL